MKILSKQVLTHYLLVLTKRHGPGFIKHVKWNDYVVIQVFILHENMLAK